MRCRWRTPLPLPHTLDQHGSRSCHADALPSGRRGQQHQQCGSQKRLVHEATPAVVGSNAKTIDSVAARNWPARRASAAERRFTCSSSADWINPACTWRGGSPPSVHEPRAGAAVGGSPRSRASWTRCRRTPCRADRESAATAAATLRPPNGSDPDGSWIEAYGRAAGASVRRLTLHVNRPGGPPCRSVLARAGRRCDPSRVPSARGSHRSLSPTLPGRGGASVRVCR